MSALREVHPQSNHIHSDRVVLSELAVRGPFALVDEHLFCKRHHAGNFYRDWRARMAWFQPQLAISGQVRLPHWWQTVDYVAMFTRVRISPVGRLRCGAEVLRWMWEFQGVS